jgi:glycosyltransferase involved in cell wall biosynthesis
LGSDVVYVGRLTVEKGVENLLQAWRQVGRTVDRNLVIAGAGPLEDVVRAQSESDQSVSFLGFLDSSGVESVIHRAALVVVPSIWPEPDPLTAIAAMRFGRPLLATRLGALSHYLDDDSGWLVGVTADELAGGLIDACSSREELERRGAGASAVVHRRAQSHRSLPDVYRDVLNDGDNEIHAEDSRG